MKRTSRSDNGKYPQFCYLASKQEDIFQNFKRDPIYNRILEHLPEKTGAAYLKIILNDYNFRISDAQWENILLNDSLGNPRRFTYEFGDKSRICSATTLRYTKVFCDIVSLFPESILQGGGMRNWYRLWWTMQNFNEHVADSEI